MRDDEYRAMFDLEGHLWWYSGMRAISQSILGHTLSVPAPRILDIGCGTGYSVKWLGELLGSSRAYGVDVSPHAAELWRTQGLETVALGAASGLPYRSSAFDLLTCFDVIYQLNSDDARAAVAEMFRVLVPGGRLLIREPAYDWLRGAHDTAVGTQHRFTRGELSRLISSQGFTIARATYANTLLFPIALLHRVASRFRDGRQSDVRPIGESLNRFLEAILRAEAALLRRATLPFGLSILVMAEKR